MCGFCGFTGSVPDTSVLKKMTERLSHRGPDGEGFFVNEKISMGFRRLSFFDLELGNQPMTRGSLTIVFNGEIYNFREIKKDLVALGCEFLTDSDTEVLLCLYEKYGEKMLDFLRGMFAFVIFDDASGEIFAARDFFGIKPFYYGKFGGEFLFASEIKAFLDYPAFEKSLNHAALSSYLSFQYSVTDETFFSGVFKLPPAHFLRYRGGEVEIERYWQAGFVPPAQPLEPLVERIDAVFRESVEYHQRADVPIGAFLSGGFDSSYVVSVSENVEKTFTVGFDFEGFSEIEAAKNLSEARGIENISKVISAEEYWAALPEIQYFMDEPHADPSAVALYFVCKTAAQHVKGSLSGEGADELFGGYEIYREPFSLAKIAWLPLSVRKFFAWCVKKIPFGFKGKNFLVRAAKPVEERFIGNANIFTDAERADILKSPQGASTAEITAPLYEKCRHLDDTTKMQFLDMHLWLVGDILQKADKMSMANSFEARVPFLDKEVFALATTIPTRHKIRGGASKFALRKAAEKYFAGLMPRKRRGFPVPIRKWLRDEKYCSVLREAFEKPFVAEFFHPEKITALLENHKAGKSDNSRKIWTIYMFILWYERYFCE